MQDSSYPRMERGHRVLPTVRQSSTSIKVVAALPLGLGEVSMVYRSFIVWIS